MTLKNEPRTVAEWFEEGVRCFHKPDGVRALAAFNKVTDHDPAYRHTDGDNPYFYVGKIHEVEDRLEQAVVYYTRALALDAADEESLIGRGSCYTVLKEHELAIEDFMAVLQLPAKIRKVPVSHLCYAIAENYRKSHDFAQALQWGQKALHHDPANTRHQQLVRQMQARLGQKPS